MADREWGIGVDLDVRDNLVDGITFEELITTIHCNCPIINEAAAYAQLNRILEMRDEDMNELLKRNMDVILSEARKGRL